MAEQMIETPAPVETPAAPAAPAVGLHEMSRKERDSFLADGTIPTRETKPVSDGGDAADADSSTAPVEGKKTAETAAKDVKAASEPAAPAKDKKARNSEENRVQELLTDRQRERERADRAERRQQELEDRLNALERGSKADGKKDSSTTDQPSEPKWKQLLAAKEFPKIEDFADPNEWQAATVAFAQQQFEQGLASREQQTAETQRTTEIAQQAFKRGASEIEADPTILDRIHPALEGLKAARSLPADQVGPPHFAKDVILFETEKPLALMAFYSTPEGQQEWADMMRSDARGIQRTIIARELKLGSVPQGEAAAPAKEKPAAKTFTKAPAPPDKEGPKGAVPADQVGAAVGTGDFDAFQAGMDERDPASTKRWGRRRG